MGRPKLTPEQRRVSEERRKVQRREYMRQQRQCEAVRARISEQARRRRKEANAPKVAERQREAARVMELRRRQAEERALELSRTSHPELAPAAGKEQATREDPEVSVDVVSNAEDCAKGTCSLTYKPRSSNVTSDCVTIMPQLHSAVSPQAQVISCQLPSKTAKTTCKLPSMSAKTKRQLHLKAAYRPSVSVQTMMSQINMASYSSHKSSQVLLRPTVQLRYAQADLMKIVKSQFTQTRANDVAVWYHPQKT